MSEEALAPAVEQTAPVAPAAPSPVQAKAPTPPAVEPQAKDEPGEEIAYEETGDPGLDYALSFIARAGIDAEHPALIAASNGDFGLLKATLAEKGVAGWEQAVALGEKALEGIQAKQAETVKEIQSSVLQVAESLGVDWEAAISYARDNADEKEAATLNELFSKPETAKIAALYVSHVYSSAPGVDIPPAKSAVPEAAAPAISQNSGGSLTRAEFAAEAGKLYKKFGDGAASTPEYRALAARLQR